MVSAMNKCVLAQNGDQSIDEVVVESSNINTTIIPVQILDGDFLRRMPANSVADAVRYFSGVQLKDYGGVGGMKTINVRSMGSQHVGVFYDGVEMANAQNGVVDLGRFSLDNMQTISIYNGQKSSIFQSAKDFSSSSALYLETRIPEFGANDRYHHKFSLRTGSFDTFNPSFLFEFKLSDNISLGLSGDYLYTSGRYKFTYAVEGGSDTTQIRQNGDVHSFRLEAGLFGKFDNNRGKWNAKLYCYDSQRGYPGAAVRSMSLTNHERQWDTNLFFQGNIQEQFSNVYSLMFKTKISYDYLHYISDPDNTASTIYVNNEFKLYHQYCSLINLFEPCNWCNLSLSTDFQHDFLRSNLENFSNPHRYTLLNNVAVSFLWWQVKIQTNLLYTMVQEREGGKHRFSPSVTASYRPFEQIDFTLRAFYKNIFRMPTLNDLYYTYIGNVNLKPETTNQFNLGFVYGKDFYNGVLKNLQLTVDAYCNKVRNKIVAMPSGNQFRWTMLNYGRVDIIGVDAALASYWNFGPVGLNTNFTYTYQDARDVTDKNSMWYGGQIPYIPRHSFSAIAGIDWKSFCLNYSFIYTGERYESQANTADYYQQPWYTHDVSLRYSWLVAKHNFSVSLDVNNIFNQQYQIVRCYPMPGTNVSIKLNYSL